MSKQHRARKTGRKKTDISLKEKWAYEEERRHKQGYMGKKGDHDTSGGREGTQKKEGLEQRRGKGGDWGEYLSFYKTGDTVEFSMVASRTRKGEGLGEVRMGPQRRNVLSLSRMGGTEDFLRWGKKRGGGGEQHLLPLDELGKRKRLWPAKKDRICARSGTGGSGR